MSLRDHGKSNLDEVLIVYCLECSSGSYKHTISNTKCLQCPSNSASNSERTDCTCDKGFYESTDLGDCKGTRFNHAVFRIGCPHTGPLRYL